MPARLSGFFDARAARAAQGVPPRVQFADATGGFTFVVGIRDPQSGNFVANHTPIAFGTMIVLDFGAAEHGPLCYRPFDDSNLVPLGQPVPPQPDASYSMIVRVPVLVQGFPLAQWTIGGTIAQNAVFTLYTAFQHAGEAVDGMIPVCRLRPSRQIAIASRDGELHTAPVLEFAGWVERNVERFGPRTVPPPLPLLAAARPIPPLPPAANTNGPAEPNVTPPWEEPAAPAVSAAAVTAPAANDDDLFHNMAPVGKERPKF